MNRPQPDCPPAELPLLEIVDLKWLLASEGVHLHVERLQTDPAYASEILALAAGSVNAALRAAAQRLGARRSRCG